MTPQDGHDVARRLFGSCLFAILGSAFAVGLMLLLTWWFGRF